MKLLKTCFGLIVSLTLVSVTIGCSGEPATPPVEEVPTETDLGGGSDDPSAMMEDTTPPAEEPAGEDTTGEEPTTDEPTEN